jgi:hypothetical protein
LGTTQHSVHSVLEFFLGIKQPGLDVYHSPASAKVKNEWRYTPAFPIRLLGLDGGTFTSTSCTILSNECVVLLVRYLITLRLQVLGQCHSEWWLGKNL